MTASVDIDARIRGLIASERLPEHYRDIVDRCWRPLARLIAERRGAADQALVVGINGAQGSGKSTLCRFLELLLGDAGLTAATLAIDDLYLPRGERAILARDIHPLFATRGVPGTHDTDLGNRLLRELRETGTPVTLPSFDKARDDRRPDAAGRRIARPVDVILFEGWCIGAAAEPPCDLATPINRLEAVEDPDGTWRGHANDMLAGPYRDLFAAIDFMIALRPPDFRAVVDNRRLQERKLRETMPGPHVMDDLEVERFVQHFERITKTGWRRLEPAANIVVDVAADRSLSFDRSAARLLPSLG